MHRIISVAVITVLAVLLVACTPAILVGPENEMAVVPLEVGQTLIVELPAEPSSGRGWRVVKTSGLLKQREEADFEPDSTAAGSAGVASIRFEAVAAGQGSLRLEYRREYEHAADAKETYRVGLNVSE